MPHVALFAGGHLSHPAVKVTTIETHQQLTALMLSAVFAQLCLCFSGGSLQAGSPRHFLLHLLEYLPIDDGRVGVVDIILGELARVFHLLVAEYVRRESLLVRVPITTLPETRTKSRLLATDKYISSGIYVPI